MLIEVEGLAKSFGRRTVLRDVEFSVAPGEVVALAGVNGVGKSTILALLMGFLEAQSGTMRVLGHDPLTRQHLGEVGWMPEHPVFPDSLRVDALLRFQASTFQRWDMDFAHELAERLEIDLRARPRQMSRGELGRLALICAMGHRPRLLLLDDPTLGLDPTARRLLLGEILAEAADGGTGVLLSTHLLAEVGRAVDRLLVLRDGCIVFDRSADEIEGSLEDAFVRVTEEVRHA